MIDVSKEWGVDWLHDSRCPLFFDWDNDGDQDLAVSVLGGVMLAENNGNQTFKLHNILSTSDDTQSMAAADYDQDGDIDLYVCVYRRDGKTSGEMTSLLPGEAENFVYHDANTGGPSALFSNDGNGGFTNVTESVGMGENNYRFSYAASWTTTIMMEMLIFMLPTILAAIIFIKIPMENLRILLMRRTSKIALVGWQSYRVIMTTMAGWIFS